MAQFCDPGDRIRATAEVAPGEVETSEFVVDEVSEEGAHSFDGRMESLVPWEAFEIGLWEVVD